ncbi:hypothetical protein D3C76_1608260 [compost metagenome]
MNALAAKGLAELLLQQVVDAVEDEVHYFDRGVDDTEALGHLGEGVTEELVVQLDDDLLLALGVVDARCALAHAGVELLQSICFFGQVVLMKRV